MTNVVPLYQRNDPSAYRPQPARDGPDFWPTIDRHLILALVHEVLPALPAAPAAPIWEAAAGAGHLVASSFWARGDRHRSLSKSKSVRYRAPRFPAWRSAPETRAAVMMTNPPNSVLSEFMVRGLTLIDTGRLAGMVLLVRIGHDVADGRAAAFNRAAAEWRKTGRAWISGYCKEPAH